MFQVSCITGKYADAVEFSIPVVSPVNRVTNIMSGGLRYHDHVISQSISLPNDILENYGAVEVTLSASMLLLLEDCLSFVCEYPFDTTEALASKMLMLLTFDEMLNLFNVNSIPTPAVCSN